MNDATSNLPVWNERSPELMSRGDTSLLVVDVQEKLVRLIPDHERIVWNIRRLLDGAKLLGLPIVGTEQYPQGLGPTTPELATRLDAIPAKVMFSCRGCEGLPPLLSPSGQTKVLIVGIEAHVCVLQTALDLLALGYRVYVAVDAIGSRHSIDYETALRRLEACGASLVTTEMALFEWCEVAGTPEFKAISQLVRETLPQSIHHAPP